MIDLSAHVASNVPESFRDCPPFWSLERTHTPHRRWTMRYEHAVENPPHRDNGKRLFREIGPSEVYRMCPSNLGSFVHRTRCKECTVKGERRVRKQNGVSFFSDHIEHTYID